jgi:hypothetical protein
MYLKCHSRLKDGKEHRYYEAHPAWRSISASRTKHTIAEKVACAGGRWIERHVFYLAEINGWTHGI